MSRVVISDSGQSTQLLLPRWGSNVESRDDVTEWSLRLRARSHSCGMSSGSKHHESLSARACCFFRLQYSLISESWNKVHRVVPSELTRHTSSEVCPIGTLRSILILFVNPILLLICVMRYYNALITFSFSSCMISLFCRNSSSSICSSSSDLCLLRYASSVWI